MPVSPSRIALVVMAKAPVPGRVKTRLAPPLDPGEAAALAEAMLLDTLDTVDRLVGDDEGLEGWLAYSPSSAEDYFRCVAPAGIGLMPQSGEDLGERMHAIVVDRLAAGAAGVLLLGSDLPTLPPGHMKRAADLLSGGCRLVLGPAGDGGYYLVGLDAPEPRLFQGIAWGGPDVLDRTVRAARGAGLEPAMLPSWYDVDTPDELARLGGELHGRSETSRPRRTAEAVVRIARTHPDLFTAPPRPRSPSSGPGPGGPFS